MERRILLAFILSFVVLSAWSMILPKQSKDQMSNLKVSDQLNSEIEISKEPISVSIPVISAENVQPSEFLVLENSKILVEFSNKGGSLTSVVIKEHNTPLPVTNILTLDNYSDVVFKVESKTDTSVVYSYEKDGHSIRKLYSVEDDDYLVKSEIQIEGDSGTTMINAFNLDINRLDKSEVNAQDHSLFEYFILSPTQSFRKENAVKFSNKEAKRQEVETVDLAGFRNRYFSVIIHPEFKSKEFVVTPIDSAILSVKIVPEDGETYAATIYLGPQKLDLLKKYGLGFDRAMVFSNWGWLDALAKGIYSIMHWMHKIVPNWGLCIIFISFLIYGSMYPLTMSGMASMKRMQAVQPKMNSLREQYKNNPQRLNKEIMELYKEHKVNPVGGCLPLFLQMPVFVALYQVLWRSVDFQGAHFLWIKDLSQPDRLAILPFSLPVIGNEFNILPLVMMVIMFFQQKLSAKSMVITDPSQEAQQKMMTIIFPIMLGFIFYKFASGLSLYFTMFYSMSTLAQWKMSKNNVKVVQDGK